MRVWKNAIFNKQQFDMHGPCSMDDEKKNAARRHKIHSQMQNSKNVQMNA